MRSVPPTGSGQKACGQDLPKAQVVGLRASALFPKKSTPFPTNAFSFLTLLPRHTGGLPRNLTAQQKDLNTQRLGKWQPR